MNRHQKIVTRAGISLSLIVGGGLSLNQWSNDVYAQEVACPVNPNTLQASACASPTGKELRHSLNVDEAIFASLGALGLSLGFAEGLAVLTTIGRPEPPNPPEDRPPQTPGPYRPLNF